MLPLLFWCLINDLISRLNGSGLNTQGYDNDIYLLAVVKLLNKVSELIQGVFHTIEVWCDVAGL
jgi:hypothetical protein